MGATRIAHLGVIEVETDENFLAYRIVVAA